MGTLRLTLMERRQLLQSALDARSLAYVPYSSFRVGAALLLKDGQIFLGANVENASYGAGICAERTALVKAATSHAPAPTAAPSAAKKSPLAGNIKAVAVASDLTINPCSPCGICRQFLREFCDSDAPIYMVWNEWKSEQEPETEAADPKGYVKKTLNELLPLSFGPEELDRPKAF